MTLICSPTYEQQWCDPSVTVAMVLLVNVTCFIFEDLKKVLNCSIYSMPADGFVIIAPPGHCFVVSVTLCDGKITIFFGLASGGRIGTIITAAGENLSLTH